MMRNRRHRADSFRCVSSLSRCVTSFVYSPSFLPPSFSWFCAAHWIPLLDSPAGFLDGRFVIHGGSASRKPPQGKPAEGVSLRRHRDCVLTSRSRSTSRPRTAFAGTSFRSLSPRPHCTPAKDHAATRAVRMCARPAASTVLIQTGRQRSRQPFRPLPDAFASTFGTTRTSLGKIGPRLPCRGHRLA